MQMQLPSPLRDKFQKLEVLQDYTTEVADLRWDTSTYTAQKMEFSIKDFCSKCGQIRRKLRIWSRLLKKSLMENFIFCAVLEGSLKLHCCRAWDFLRMTNCSDHGRVSTVKILHAMLPNSFSYKA